MKNLFTLFTAALFSLSMLADVYTVVGEPAALFGTEWDEWNESNDMTYVDGHYEWTLQNVYIPAGQIQYRIVKDHNWETVWPVGGPRYSNQLTEGIYNITITFTLDTHQPGLIPERVGDYVPAVYSLAGSKDLLQTTADWNPDDTSTEMTLDSDDGLYKYTVTNVTLAAGTDYEFKVLKDHSWGTCYPAGPNEKINVDKDGIYNVTITFNANTEEIGKIVEFVSSAVVEKHYLVVGDSEVANGIYWDNDADINLMTSDDGGQTYKLVVTGARLYAKTAYGFKIVEKGSWTEYYPKQGGLNAVFTVPEHGIYTLTYTYTVATEECTLNAEKTGDIPAPRLQNCFYLVGTFSGVEAWTVDALDASKKFQLVEQSDTYELYVITASLAIGDEIKAVWVTNDEITFWLPSIQQPGVEVTANYAGEEKIIYIYYDSPNNYLYIWIDPNLYNGYYLLGTMNEWHPTKEYMFTQNPENEAEYLFPTLLTEGDEFKVVYIEDGEWYDEDYFPGDGAGNFVVDAAHAGEKTIYFRPDYQGGEDWYYNCIFVPANGGNGLDKIISSGKATKIMRDGQIRIIKGNKTFNLLGGAAE